MAWVNHSDLPSHKGGHRFFLLSSVGSKGTPFPFTGTSFLSPNSLRLVEDFGPTMGQCLGGGVLKSKDLEDRAKKSPQSQAINKQLKSQLSRLPARVALHEVGLLQTEWVALEYALLLTVPIYGSITTIDWDNLDSLAVGKKGLMSSDLKSVLRFRNPKGEAEVATIQSNPQGMQTLAMIARACGVPVDM